MYEKWKSSLTLWEPIDYMVHGILRARILEWVTFPFSKGSSQPMDGTQVSHITVRFFTNWAIREACQNVYLSNICIKAWGYYGYYEVYFIYEIIFNPAKMLWDILGARHMLGA